MVTSQKTHHEKNRSSAPPAHRGGNKTVLLLLVAGIAILAIAGLVLLTRKPDAPAPAAAPADDTIYAASQPLVTTPARPILQRPPDAGTAPQKLEPEKKIAHGGGDEKLGTVDAAAVNKMIGERFGEVRACYERRLKMNPLLQGDLDLAISISTAGKVTGIGVNSDSIRDAEMLDCVRRAIRRWTFPKPEGGRAVIAKNFKFKPKG
jgi:hypothetical protein